jgi:hypothetical protein
MDAVFEEAQQENRKLRGCILTTTSVSRSPIPKGAAIVCERSSTNAVFDAILLAMVPVDTSRSGGIDQLIELVFTALEVERAMPVPGLAHAA